MTKLSKLLFYFRGVTQEQIDQHWLKRLLRKKVDGKPTKTLLIYKN